MKIICSLVLLLVAPTSMSLSAADTFITTWRGPEYNGVMPAKDLVRRFMYYDENAPPPDKILPINARNAQKQLQALGLESWPTPGTQHNVCWRVPLPSWGQSTPVAVGDKVFVTCDAILQTKGQHQLVCVDIAEGTIDWTRPIDHLLAWEDEAQVAEMQAIRMAETTSLAEAMRTWNGVWWDNERHRVYGSDPDKLEDGFGVSKQSMGKPHPDRQARYDAAVAAGYKIEKGYRTTGRFGHPDRHASLKRAAKTRARIYSVNHDTPWYGSTMASAVGDGMAVYAVAAPDAVVCYELDGSLRWAADMAAGGRPSSGFKDQHLNMTSPILVAGRLVYFNTNDLRVFAYDCATGELAWRTSLPGEVDSWREREYRKFENGLFPRGVAGHMGPGGTPVPMTLPDGDGRVPVVVIPSGHVFRLSDGACLGWFNQFRDDEDYEKSDFVENKHSTYGSSVVVDDVYYSVKGTATRLAIEDGRLVSERLWTAVEDDRSGKVSHNSNQSLTLVRGRGILAAGGRGGGGELWDLTTGKPLATELRHGGHSYTSGCISADGLMLWHGGFWGPRKTRLATRFNLVPLREPKDYRISLIVESGTNELPDFEQRLIDRFGVTRIHSGWQHPSAFGNRIFVRTHTHLYCFGEGPWQDYR